MRKLLLAALAMSLVGMQYVPAHANNDDFSGMILLPVPIVGTGSGGAIGDVSTDCVPGVDAGCEKGSFSGLYRRLYILGGEAVQGTFGWAFPIATTGGQFTLSSTGPAPGDFDISFYKNLGGVSPTADDPLGPAPNTDFGAQRGTWANLSVDPETGKVPTGARFAIVTCLCVGGSFKFDN